MRKIAQIFVAFLEKLNFSDLNANSWPSASNFKRFSQSHKQFFSHSRQEQFLKQNTNAQLGPQTFEINCINQTFEVRDDRFEMQKAPNGRHERAILVI